MNVITDVIDDLNANWRNVELEVREPGVPAWRGTLQWALTRSDQALGGEVGELCFVGARRVLVPTRDVLAASVEGATHEQPRHVRFALKAGGATTITLASDPLRDGARSGFSERRDAEDRRTALVRAAQAESVRERVLIALAGMWGRPLRVVDSMTVPRERRPANYGGRGWLPRATLERSQLLQVTATAEDVRLRFTAPGARGHEAVVRFASATVEIDGARIVVQDGRDEEARFEIVDLSVGEGTIQEDTTSTEAIAA